MSWIEIIADRKIRDAQEDGAFDNLPGRGKPLKLDYDPRIPPEQRAAFRLMKEANLLPDWIEMDKETRLRLEQWDQRVEAFAASSRTGPEPTPRGEKPDRRQEAKRIAERDSARDAFILRSVLGLRELNRLIDRFNLIVPTLSKQRLRLPLREKAEWLEARFPRQTPRPGGAAAPWAKLLEEDRRVPQLGNRMPLRRR
jgi:hypothetical protein